MILILLACYSTSSPKGDGSSTAGDPTDSGAEGTSDDSGRGDSGRGDSGAVDETLRAPLQFTFPLLEAELFRTLLGVDHDPVVQEEGFDQLYCSDYLGRSFPHCYDEHDGSDFLLQGGFTQMDNGSATILAADAGVVVGTEDGHYDRCHGDFSSGTVSCDGYDGIANYVILEHEGGYRSRYWHMMKGSVQVAVGDVVAMGDILGIVGSSGNSTQPHLHFELEDADGVVIDPFAGPLSQPETWWCDQGDGEEMPGSCP